MSDFSVAFSDVLKFAITLVSILNPIGVIPIFLNMTNRFSVDKTRQIVRSCAISVVVTIFITLILGQQILNFFGISIASFTVGGSILIASMAFSMISARQSQAKLNPEEIQTTEEEVGEVGIVPLAIPLLAGPGVMSTSIIQSKTFVTPIHWIGAALVVLSVGVIVYFTLISAQKISDRLGRLGLNVMTRVMGIILLAISIELLAKGLKEIFPSLG